jgi:hypothetical protein
MSAWLIGCLKATRLGGVNIMNEVQGIEYLNDLERGDIDCKNGDPAPDNQSEAYYIGYGARYVYEQTKSAGEFN